MVLGCPRGHGPMWPDDLGELVCVFCGARAYPQVNHGSLRSPVGDSEPQDPQALPGGWCVTGPAGYHQHVVGQGAAMRLARDLRAEAGPWIRMSRRCRMDSLLG